MTNNTYAAHDTPPTPADKKMRRKHTKDSIAYNMQHMADHGKAVADSLAKLKSVSPDDAKQQAVEASGMIGLIHNKVNGFTGGNTMAQSMTTKKTGTFAGKSNALGGGGRAAQLKAKGMSGALIGYLGRKKYGAKAMAQMSAAGRARNR